MRSSGVTASGCSANISFPSFIRPNAFLCAFSALVERRHGLLGQCSNKRGVCARLFARGYSISFIPHNYIAFLPGK